MPQYEHTEVVSVEILELRTQLQRPVATSKQPQGMSLRCLMEIPSSPYPPIVQMTPPLAERISGDHHQDDPLVTLVDVSDQFQCVGSWVSSLQSKAAGSRLR